MSFCLSDDNSDDYDDNDDDDDYSRVCGKNSRCPWKNCAVHCLCCAGLPAQAALADSSVFHKNYTRSLERESISAQFFLSNSFRIIFRIRLMLKVNDDG